MVTKKPEKVDQQQSQQDERQATLIKLMPLTEVIADINNDAPIQFSFSSTRSVERWAFWDCDEDDLPEGSSYVFDEILSHEARHWNLERVNLNVCPFLKNHNRNDKLGQVASVWFENDIAHASVRLRDTPNSEQFRKDLKNNVAGGVSFGYQVKKYEVVKAAEYEEDRYGKVLTKKAVLKAVDIELVEISAEEIPADPTIGFNKSYVFLKSNNTIGNPNFLRTKDEVNMAVKTEKSDDNSDNTGNELVQRVEILSKEVSTLNNSISEKNLIIAQKDKEVLTLQQENAALKSKIDTTERYFASRTKAEKLNSEGRLSHVELKELFSESFAEDINKLTENPSRLGYYEMHLEIVEKRSPLLKLETSVNEPIVTEKHNQPLNNSDKQQINEETEAQRILNKSRQTPIIMS